MKLLIFICLVIFKHFAFAEEVSVKCRYSYWTTESEDQLYTCELSEIQLADNNSTLVIAGEHLEDKTDEDVKSLVFKNSKIYRFPGEIFKKFEYLERIDSSDSGITVIHPNQFQHANYLDMLFLDKNNLTKVETKMFDGALFLRYLDLSRNQINMTDKDAFFGLKNLETLILNENLIKKLPSDAFKGLPNLKELHLQGNEINEINSSGFQGLPSLLALDVSNNQLIEWNKYWIRSLLNVAYLDVSGNNIQILEPLENSNKKTLQFFKANRNQVSKMHIGFFDNMPNLKFVGLEGNICINRNFSDMNEFSRIFPVFRECFNNYHTQAGLMLCSLEHTRRGEYYCNIKKFRWVNGMDVWITEFHGDWIMNNDKVLGVEFFDSQISEIPAVLCRNFPNLNSLYVNNTKLSQLFPPDNYLCYRLRNLFASNNLVRRLEANAFKQQDYLVDIRLDRNQITEIHYDAFNKLKNLKYLDLSHNKLKVLFSNTFQYQSLRQLNLSNNNLDVFDASSLSSLVSLDLRNNQIKRIQTCYFFGLLKDIRELQMENNTCISKDFKFWGSEDIDLVKDEFSSCWTCTI